MGSDIVRRALESPLRWIAHNAGVEGSIVVQKVKEAKEVPFGYNAATDKYEDLTKAGVIDPTKVVRSALQNASSIASLPTISLERCKTRAAALPCRCRSWRRSKRRLRRKATSS